MVEVFIVMLVVLEEAEEAGLLAALAVPEVLDLGEDGTSAAPTFVVIKELSTDSAGGISWGFFDGGRVLMRGPVTYLKKKKKSKKLL